MILTTNSYYPISISWLAFTTKAVVRKKMNLYTEKHRFRTRASSYETCGGQNDPVSGFFSPNTLVFPWQYHFTKHSPVSNISPMLHTHHLNATFIRRTSGENWETSKQISFLSGNTGQKCKANLFLVEEQWPETLSKSLSYRGTMARNVKQISFLSGTLARNVSSR